MSDSYMDIRCPASREYTTKDGSRVICNAFMGAVSKESIGESLVLRCPVCRKMYNVVTDQEFVHIKETKGHIDMRTAWRIVNG